MEIKDRFELVSDEYMNFDHIEKKRSNRADVNAFILLDELFGPKKAGDDLIDAASHDVFYLSTTLEDIETLEDHHIIELVRCGVMFDSDEECLFMFT